MAAPSSYTESQLKTLMHGLLGRVATALGWSVAGGDYDEPVNDALLAGGWSDISEVSGAAAITKLRTLAKVAVWRWVVPATAAHIDIKSGPSEMDWSQLHAQARTALALAESDALAYSDSYAVQVDGVHRIHDPYAYYPDELRTRP